MSSITLNKKNISLNFNEMSGNLQSIRYKNNNMYFHQSIWNIDLIQGSTNTKYSIEDMKEFKYNLHKDDIELIWESEILKVKVCILFANKKFKWKITVGSKTDEVYINKVLFPIIGSIKSFNSKGYDDYLLLPWQNGWLIKNPVNTLLSYKEKIPFWLGRGNEKYENEYPAQYSFQFSAYYSEENYGYYFSTEDSNAYIKTMGFYKSEVDQAFDFILTNYPENMGETKYYSMPYYFILDFFEGDWQTATKRYRKWAIEQKWCKEKLVEKNLPKNLLNTDLWLINHKNYDYGTKVEDYYNTAVTIKEKFECNIALHWYGWNKGQHDVNLPEYISEELINNGWPEKLQNWNEKFQNENIVKIPYVNARMWDANTKSWFEDNAKKSALKNNNLDLYKEPWNGNRLKPMCPATSLWSNKVIDFCDEYVTKLNFDGLYLDQIASYNATLCFDKSHPHPIGGGIWWNHSYHKIVNTLRSIIGQDKILTTESCCETYIDVFDLFLILDTNFFKWGFNEIVGAEYCEAIPLFSMIYGDRALSYGSISTFNDPQKLFEIKFVRNLLWGILPTIEGVEYSDIYSEQTTRHMDVLKRGLSFFRDHKDLFVFGRLKEVISYDCNKINVVWEMNGIEKSKKYPALIIVVWEDKDGQDMTILYNLDERSHKVKIAGAKVRIDSGSFVII